MKVLAIQNKEMLMAEISPTNEANESLEVHSNVHVMSGTP